MPIRRRSGQAADGQAGVAAAQGRRRQASPARSAGAQKGLATPPVRNSSAPAAAMSKPSCSASSHSRGRSAGPGRASVSGEVEPRRPRRSAPGRRHRAAAEPERQQPSSTPPAPPPAISQRSRITHAAAPAARGRQRPSPQQAVGLARAGPRAYPATGPADAGGGWRRVSRAVSLAGRTREEIEPVDGPQGRRGLDPAVGAGRRVVLLVLGLAAAGALRLAPARRSRRRRADRRPVPPGRPGRPAGRPARPERQVERGLLRLHLLPRRLPDHPADPGRGQRRAGRRRPRTSRWCSSPSIPARDTPAAAEGLSVQRGLPAAAPSA